MTSRRPLRVRGEREYSLVPLLVPADDQDVAFAPAVQLFVQRAADVRQDFALTEENQVAVAKIVQLVDGLPLAIELAAARSRLLSPKALAERLTHQVGTLAGRLDDLPARQRTLKATLDWSYQLLSDPEKTLFARLSVFSGSATLEAVEAICSDDRVGDVVEGIFSLLENSLVVMESVDKADGPRVRMLHVVRAHAAELLAERDEAERLRDRHARWYADLVEPADIIAHNDAPRSWPLLSTEADNVLAAARWSAARGDVPLLIAFGRRLWPWLSYTGRIGELRDAIPAPVDDADNDAPARQQAFLHNLAVCYAQTQTGDHAAALATAERALTLAGDSPDRETGLLVSSVRLLRGALRLSLGQTAGVEEDLGAALNVARREDNAWLLGHATLHRGVWRTITGDTAGARADLNTAVTVASAMQHEVLSAQALGHLSDLDLLAGRLNEALDHLRQQVQQMRQSQNVEGLATALDTAAALAAHHRRWETAYRAAVAADDLRRRVALPPRPVTRDLHDSAVQAALQHLDDRQPANEAASAGTDPWTLADETVTELTDLRRQAPEGDG